MFLDSTPLLSQQSTSTFLQMKASSEMYLKLTQEIQAEMNMKIQHGLAWKLKFQLPFKYIVICYKIITAKRLKDLLTCTCPICRMKLVVRIILEYYVAIYYIGINIITYMTQITERMESV